MNVLFTNAGRKTYLIENALELIGIGFDINVFVSDVCLHTASLHVSPEVKRISTPFVTNNEELYLHTLLKECEKNNINIIIPLMDYELPILSKNKKEFEKLGIRIWISDFSTISNCLDKRKNYSFCLENSIVVPKSWFQKQKFDFKTIRKKIWGSGSIGQQIIVPETEFEFSDGEDMLQEYITGKEIGMDVFNDYNGNYVHSSFRKKILMRSGETDKAITFYDKKYEQLAKEISKAFKHVGNMDIDLIETEDGRSIFIDFNPRFGGGYPFSYLSGVNYIRYIVEESLGLTPSRPVFKKSITGMKGLKVFYYEN